MTQSHDLAAEYQAALCYLPPMLREVLERVPEGEKSRIQEVHDLDDQRIRTETTVR